MSATPTQSEDDLSSSLPTTSSPSSGDERDSGAAASSSSPSSVDSILAAMAERQEKSLQDAGARLLALLHLKSSGGGSAAPEPPAPASSSSSPPLLRYPRGFLLDCAASDVCGQMPLGLEEKLRLYPQLQRRPLFEREEQKPPASASATQPQRLQPFRPGQGGQRSLRQASAADYLPLRPTAQIFTWDPAQNEWVPRARPQET